MIRAWMPMLAVFAVTMLAACGGDSGEAFVADADAICTETVEERLAINADIGALDSDAEAIEMVDRIEAAEQGANERLRGLEVPEDVAAGYEEFVSLREQATALSADARAAAESGDPDAFGELAVERDALLTDAAAAAAGIGMDRCGGVVSDESREQIADVVERSAASGGGDCAELFTDSYVEATFEGSLERCDAESKVADSTELLDVEGIDDLAAEADARLSGGPFDGDTFEVVLVSEAGAWKIDAVSPVE